MKLRFAMIGFLLVGGVLGLALTTGGSSSETIVVVDAQTVVQEPDRYADRELRVRGFVERGSIMRYGDAADFIVSQEDVQLPVHFTGATQLPDTFTDGAPVRVDGHLEEGRLVATKVEAKCASKYEGEYVAHPEQIQIQQP